MGNDTACSGTILGDVAPATLAAGTAAPVTLVVRGQHFTETSVVEWEREQPGPRSTPSSASG